MKNFKFDVDQVREQFPCLSKTVNGYPAAFLDGPGGSQVPVRVVEKINDYLFYHNANSHGSFLTSKESDQLYWQAREVFADFLNCGPEEVTFGANTSSNNFMLALSLVRTMKAGDEVIITEIDHEGNRSPWRTLEDFGIIVKCVKVDPLDCILDFEDYQAKLTEKTKVVAINWAANACGTITDVKRFIDLAHEYGALTVVDAVHYAPHHWIDVKEIGTDFLLCSPYKFFGPRFGVLYVKKEVGEQVKTVRVMADDNTEMPFKFETGTVPMELACGAAEAVQFIADIGTKYEACFAEELAGYEEGRRRQIVAGMMTIESYEEPLAKKLRAELGKIEGIKIYGPKEGHPRTPTVCFTMDGVNAAEMGKYLGDQGLFVWDGDFYAVEIINHVWNLTEVGGLVRIGLAPYNTENEIDRTISAVKEFCNR